MLVFCINRYKQCSIWESKYSNKVSCFYIDQTQAVGLFIDQ